MQLSLILENQIRVNRQTLHCQEVVGPILKNLFEKGITENKIIAMKGLIDILLYNPSSIEREGNNIAKANIKYENFGNADSLLEVAETFRNKSDLFNNNNYISYNNWKKECEKSISTLTLHIVIMLLFSVDFEKIKSDIDRFRISLPSIHNHENSDYDDNRKQQEGVADSII